MPELNEEQIDRLDLELVIMNGLLAHYRPQIIMGFRDQAHWQTVQRICRRRDVIREMIFNDEDEDDPA